MTGINRDDWDLDDPVERAAYVAAMDDCGGDCGTYLPGHEVHWSQAGRAAKEPARPVRVTGIDGHRATLLFDDGSAEVVWHHRPLCERLQVGQRAWRREYGILALSPTEDGGIPLLCVRRELP